MIISRRSSSIIPRMRDCGWAARPGLAVAATLALGGLTNACQSYIFDQKCPEAITEARRSVAVAEAVPVDILFVIDNSGSMGDEQANLIRNFESFIQVIAGGPLDYRIAVVTTDLGNSSDTISAGPERAGRAGFEIDTESPVRVVDSSDTSGCQTLNNTQHGCFRSGRSALWIDSQVDDAATVRSAFADMAGVGTCGSGLERGTTAMLEALRNTQASGCNAGFLRAEANLVVVIISDEDDFRPLPEDDLLRELGQIKPLQQVRIALIGGIVDGAPSTCRTGPNGSVQAMCGSACNMPRPEREELGPCGSGGACPTFYRCLESICVNIAWSQWPNIGSGLGCDSCSDYSLDTCCSADIGAQAYYRFVTAFEQTAAGLDPSIEANGCQGTEEGKSACLVDSICQGEFAATLERIARDLVVSTRVVLNPPASYPPGVVVQIRGGRYSDSPRILDNGTDFTVEELGSVVRFRSADLLPRADEDLDIFFTIENTIDAPQLGACAE